MFDEKKQFLRFTSNTNCFSRFKSNTNVFLALKVTQTIVYNCFSQYKVNKGMTQLSINIIPVMLVDSMTPSPGKDWLVH